MSRRSAPDRRNESGFRPVAGLAVGVGIWVLGYLASLLVTVAYFSSGPQSAPSDPVLLVKSAGWVFYNSHFVPLDGIGRIDNIVQSVGGVFLSLMVVTPVLVVLGGSILAYGRRRASTAGLSLVVGYCPVTLAGVFLLPGPLAGTTIAPNSLVATVVMALGYPLALGAAGGSLLARVDDDTGRPGRN